MKTVVAVSSLAAVLLWTSGPARADEPSSSNVWQSSVAMGLNMTRGNSETLNTTVNLLTEKKEDPGSSWRIGADAAYGEDAVTTTVERVKAFIGCRQDLSSRVYALIDVSVEHDSIADLEYRFIASPGLGYYFLRAETQTLSVESGPAFIREKIGDEINDRFALRFAEKFECKIGDDSKLWQSVEYLPGVDDLANYLVNAEIGAEAAVNARLSLRLLWKNTYNSKPAEGREQNDLSFTGAVVCKF